MTIDNILFLSVGIIMGWLMRYWRDKKIFEEMKEIIDDIKKDLSLISKNQTR